MTAAPHPSGQPTGPVPDADIEERNVVPGPMDEVPHQIQEAARIAPDHWFGMVDPDWRGEGSPPRWAVLGEYRSSPEGEVVEWRYNDDYRPSPSAQGWPPPTDPLDEAVQRAATGYGPEDDVHRLLADEDTEVSILLAPDGSPLSARTPDGSPVVPVFSSGQQVQSAARLASATKLVSELVRELPTGQRLYINPMGAVSMVVDPEMLATTGQEAPETEPVREADPLPESPPTPVMSVESDPVPEREREHLEEPEPDQEPQPAPEPGPASPPEPGPGQTAESGADGNTSPDPGYVATGNRVIDILNGL